MPADPNKLSLPTRKDGEKRASAESPKLRPEAQRRDFLYGCRKTSAVNRKSLSRRHDGRRHGLLAAPRAMGKRDRADRGERWRGRVRLALARARRPLRAIPGSSAVANPAVSRGLHVGSRRTAGGWRSSAFGQPRVLGRVGTGRERTPRPKVAAGGGPWERVR